MTIEEMASLFNTTQEEAAFIIENDALINFDRYDEVGEFHLDYETEGKTYEDLEKLGKYVVETDKNYLVFEGTIYHICDGF